MERIVGVIMILLMVGSCGDRVSEKAAEKPLNPNGDSELALLMREMFTEGERIKAQIENGQTPSGLRKFGTIHSAIPTVRKFSGPVFDSFASAYLASLREIEKGDSSTVFRFNGMVDQCMNCHTEFCPGPRKRIKQLYITQ